VVSRAIPVRCSSAEAFDRTARARSWAYRTCGVVDVALG
jgi:hypothetical protein